MISNSDWYYTDVHQKCNIIYHFLYGLTRPGNNVWLINAEKKWMEQKGIVYDYDNINTKHKTCIKGFVYSIMHSMFSNHIQKTFRKKNAKSVSLMSLLLYEKRYGIHPATVSIITRNTSLGIIKVMLCLHRKVF